MPAVFKTGTGHLEYIERHLEYIDLPRKARYNEDLLKLTNVAAAFSSQHVVNMLKLLFEHKRDEK